MKNIVLISVLFCFFNVILNAQDLTPTLSFSEKPGSYSMHLCFDGNLYYSVNGGVPAVGKISSFTLQGNFIKSYPILLDMRSIMYNKKDKSFYVTTTNRKIFRIIDMIAGTYELVFSNLYENKQASLSFGHKGKNLYAFDQGTVSIYNFKTGALIRTLAGLKCGDGNRKGAGTVAVDKEFIYTWDAATSEVYSYDMEGKFVKSFVLSDGDFGYSLSYANGMIFVSHSPQGKTGHWYGYNLWGR